MKAMAGALQSTSTTVNPSHRSLNIRRQARRIQEKARSRECHKSKQYFVFTITSNCNMFNLIPAAGAAAEAAALQKHIGADEERKC